MKVPTAKSKINKAGDIWRRARDKRKKVAKNPEPIDLREVAAEVAKVANGGTPDTANADMAGPVPAPAPIPNVIMAGAVEMAGTHKVTMGVTTHTAGPNFLMLSITEARLLAKSLNEWAQHAEDKNNGKG